MEKIVVEVGSTCTKIDKFDGSNVVHLNTVPIEFKRHFKIENKLYSKDIQKLIDLVNNIQSDNIFVCGTSVFRQLSDIERNNFLDYFKSKTGIEF